MNKTIIINQKPIATAGYIFQHAEQFNLQNQLILIYPENQNFNDTS